MLIQLSNNRRMRTVLCDAHLELHKKTWSHKSGVGCGAALWMGRPFPRRQASAVLFSTTHTQRPAVSQLFVHRTPRLALAAWEARMAAPCRMHCTVTFGETSQPSSLAAYPHPILSCRVWNHFFWLSSSVSLLLDQLPTLALPRAPRFCH